MLLITGITGHSGKHFLNELKLKNFKDRIRALAINKKSLIIILGNSFVYLKEEVQMYLKAKESQL